MSTVLWLSLAYLAYTFVGYPIIVAILAKWRPRPISKSVGISELPAGSVSIIIALYNETERVVSRLGNLLDTDFPSDRVEVIAVSDGSSDTTADALIRFAKGEPRVRAIILSERSGKPSAINAASGAARGEFLMFADARQQFQRDTIPELIANFADPEVGAVSGELQIAPSATGTGAGGDLYWRIEKWTRWSESRSGSAVGCTGAVYAVRRHLFEMLPEDTILDDVVVPMEIARRGHRVIFEPRAVATDPQHLARADERRRKSRTLAGNFQMLFRYPSWLNPINCKLWWRLLSHKYSRLGAPVALAIALVSSALLAFEPGSTVVYTIAFWTQVALYALASIGLAFPKVGGKICAIPAAFVFLNYLVVRGFFHYLSRRGGNGRGWS